MDSFFDLLKASFLAESQRIADFLPQLVIGLVGLMVAFLLANRVRKLVSSQLVKRMDDPLLANFIARTIKAFIIMGGFLFFLRVIGWGSAAAGILATAGLGAFVIGFALRDIGEHFLAGIVMAFQRPFRVGDTIEVVGISGVIQGLSLRQTHLKTFDGKDVYVPNGIILKNPLYNYTIDGFLRLKESFSLAPDADIELAKSLVLKQVLLVEGVLGSPKAPSVSFSMDKNRVVTTIYFWIDTTNNISSSQIRKEIIENSLVSLRKNGFELPVIGVTL